MAHVRATGEQAQEAEQNLSQRMGWLLGGGGLSGTQAASGTYPPPPKCLQSRRGRFISLLTPSRPSNGLFNRYGQRPFSGQDNILGTGGIPDPNPSPGLSVDRVMIPAFQTRN